MKPLRISRRLTLSAAASTDAARRFVIEAYDGGPLPVNGFDLPVVVDLSDVRVVESMPLLIDHEMSVSATLGTVDQHVNDGRTFNIAGIVTGTSPLAQQVLAQADKGQRWQASISANIGELEEIPSGRKVTVNGQVFAGPLYVARHSEIFETSVLPVGADMTTKVNLAAAAAKLKGAKAMSFEDWIKSMGLDVATLAEEDKAALMLAYDAKQNPAPATSPAPPAAAAAPAAPAAPAVAPAALAAKAADDSVKQMQDTIRAAAASEHRRINQIQVLCASHPTIGATAIEKGWTIEQTEIAVLKAEKQSAAKTPDNRIRSTDVTPRVLEAAFCIARKVPGHEKQFTEQELQAAHTQFRSRIGLQQIIMQAAAANGYQFAAGAKITAGNCREILRFAFRSEDRGQVQAAFTTVSLPGIFANVANKELLAGYESDPAYMLWREIAGIKSVSDFKTVTSYRLLDNSTYEELPPGGKMKHGSVGEESYTRTAKTYAKLFKLTMQDIVNDDLGAFDDLRQRLGAGGARKLSDLFWATFMNNSSFFTSARGNYISGSTTNLGTDAVGLQLGITGFRNMTTPTADGTRRLGGEPEILMVPNELSYVAEQFYVNTNLGGGTTVANANIHAKKYRPLVVPWLSDASFTGYSSTAWYLLRNPGRYPTMVVSFLDGQEQPTVESADADFDELGVQFRGYHSFGCDQAEYVGGLKSKGAA